jgi:DNA-binding MarR family transcriptional regulator
MSGGIKKKTSWHLISLNIILVIMTVSFVFVQGNDIGEGPFLSMSVISGGISIKAGTSFGTHMCLDIASIFPTDMKSGMLVTTATPESFSTIILTDLNFWFDQVPEIALISITILSFELYNLFQSSKDPKTWGKNRWLIKTTISQNPGISLRALSRSTGLAIGSTQYWLRILQDNNEVDDISLGKSKHFFDCEQNLSLDEKLVYSLLQNKRIRAIIDVLSNYPTSITQTELCTRLGLNKSLLSYYVKILKKYNILETELNGLLLSNDLRYLFNRKN